MNILLVEDDSAKAGRILDFLNESYHPSVEVCRSLKSGLKAVISSTFDLIILDMTLPNFDIGGSEDGGRPLVFGGREILRQMKRRDINQPVVITTQFEQFGSGEDLVTRDALGKELDIEYSDFYLGMVYYHATEERWRTDLSSIIESLRNMKMKS